MEVIERLRVLTAASWRIQFFWDMTLCHWLSGSQFWKIIFPSLSDILRVSLVLRKRIIFSSQRLLDLCRWRNYGASKHRELLTQWLNITSQKTRIHTKVAWWKVYGEWSKISKRRYHRISWIKGPYMDKFCHPTWLHPFEQATILTPNEHTKVSEGSTLLPWFD